MALVCGNSLDLPIAMFGVHAAGAQAVPINPAYTTRELAHILSDAHVGDAIAEAVGRVPPRDRDRVDRETGSKNPGALCARIEPQDVRREPDRPAVTRARARLSTTTKSPRPSNRLLFR